ncbi:50S ribosomal protein L20 [Candidatus Collierbacteria bacterium]|nr:50S ribosomal protein L20 [Candidatus Collierbacteria bacterium]
MRVKTGVTRHRHHKKVLNRTRGMRMTKNRLFKVAREADLHAGQYAFAGRKRRKRDFRNLWIVRINAALRVIDEKMSYSKFIYLSKKANIEIDRKILAHLAAEDNSTFKAIFDVAAKTAMTLSVT